MQKIAQVVALAFVLAVTLCGPGHAQEATSDRAVDPGASTASFAVRHLYVQRVTGSVPIVRGTVTLPRASAIPIRIRAELDPRRIKSGDDDRDADLQGPDWFDSKRFPIWTFASTSIVAMGANAFDALGTLTVHGVAAPCTVHAEIVRGLPDPTYRATATIDRHAFGMTITRADALVGRELTLAFTIVLTP